MRQNVNNLLRTTYFVKLSLTVDFILVDKRQHDPVADNGALQRGDEREKGLLLRAECSDLTSERPLRDL